MKCFVISLAFHFNSSKRIIRDRTKTVDSVGNGSGFGTSHVIPVLASKYPTRGLM